MEGWPSLGIEVREFGGLTAIRVEAPFLRSKNRILGFTAGQSTRLREALALFGEKGLPCTLSMPYDEWDVGTFDALVAAGMRSGGNSMPLAAVPQPYEGAQGIMVRPSPPEERGAYLELYRRAFDARWPVGEDELRFQWVEDTLPCARRFVAEIDGAAVAMASMAILEDVAYLATCGVLPEFRRRGVQGAMIQARLGAAFEIGCGLALGGGGLFSPPRRNFERCGFAPLPLGMAWRAEGA